MELDPKVERLCQRILRDLDGLERLHRRNVPGAGHAIGRIDDTLREIVHLINERLDYEKYGKEHHE